MRIPARIEYSLRALSALAAAAPEPVNARTLAEVQHIPGTYVYNDRTTAGVAVHNMSLAGLADVVEYRMADGPATLASAVKTGRRFSIVHLDPPWRGTYQYDLTRPFMLEGLAVDVQELVRLGLEGAHLVVLNLPHNALASQISELAALAGCNAVVQYQYVSDFPATFGQAPAYFFGRSRGGHDETTGYHERRQRLTVDGQRVSQD